MIFADVCCKGMQISIVAGPFQLGRNAEVHKGNEAQDGVS